MFYKSAGLTFQINSNILLKYVIAFNFPKPINNTLKLYELPPNRYNQLSKKLCWCTTICTQRADNLTATLNVFAMLSLKELPFYSRANETVARKFIIDFYWISVCNCFALIMCECVFDAEYASCIENIHAYAKWYWAAAVFRWRFAE